MGAFLLFSILVLCDNSLAFTIQGSEERVTVAKLLDENAHTRDVQRVIKNKLLTSQFKSNQLNKDIEKRTEMLEHTVPKTTITSSGEYPNGSVTLKLVTLPSINVVWSFYDLKTKQRVMTLGEFRYDGSSSFIYSTYMQFIIVYLAGHGFQAEFEINQTEIMIAGTETLTGLDDYIKVTSNVSLNANTLEFDIVNKYIKPNIKTYFLPFGDNILINKIDNIVYETGIRGIYHVECELKNKVVNGLVLVLYRNENEGKLVDKSIITSLIHVQNANDTMESLMFLSKPKNGPTVVRLTPNFRYGSLFCNAVGQPVPHIDFFKDGILQNSTALPPLGPSAAAILPFDGQTVEEAYGRYVCIATSGSKTKSSDYLVKTVEHN